ncbi:MAG: ROK family protein [Candidatus Omnitrophota bacterium]
MKRINRAISVLILTSFIFNTAVSDFAYGAPINLKPSVDKLAPSSKFCDLTGRIDNQDIARVEMTLESLVWKARKSDGTLDIEKLIKNSNESSDSLFKSPVRFGEGLQFFPREAKDLPGGCWRITAKINDRQNFSGKGFRTYYAVLPAHTDALGGFPVRGYKVEEWPAVEKEILERGKTPDRASERSEDAKAINRYKESNERIISTFIRERLYAGDFAEIEGRAHALDWDAEYPNRISPDSNHNAAYWTKDIEDIFRSNSREFFDLFGIEFDKVFGKKNFVFMKIPRGMERQLDIIENGERVPVRSRTSNNAVYFFLNEDDFNEIGNLSASHDVAQLRELVISSMLLSFIHETGAACGLPFSVLEGGLVQSDLDIAYNTYWRIFTAATLEPIDVPKARLAEKFSNLKNLKAVDLDILRGVNLAGEEYNRDLAAAVFPKTAREATRAQDLPGDLFQSYVRSNVNNVTGLAAYVESRPAHERPAITQNIRRILRGFPVARRAFNRAIADSAMKNADSRLKELAAAVLDDRDIRGFDFSVRYTNTGRIPEYYETLLIDFVNPLRPGDSQEFVISLVAGTVGLKALWNGEPYYYSSFSSGGVLTTTITNEFKARLAKVKEENAWQDWARITDEEAAEQPIPQPKGPVAGESLTNQSKRKVQELALASRRAARKAARELKWATGLVDDAEPQDAEPALLAEPAKPAANLATIDAKHAYFSELHRKAGELGKKAVVELQFLEADGRIGRETVTLPIGEVSRNMDCLVDYLATLLNVRGLINGATKVAVLTKETDAGDIIARLREHLRANFGKTEFMMSFGQGISFTRKPLKAEARTENKAKTVPVDYDKGVGVGFDLGGQGIKWAQRTKPGEKPATGRVDMEELMRPGALAGFIEQKIKETEESTGQKVSPGHPCIITIPGPVTPDGRIVLITNLEKTRPGTQKELEELQAKYPRGTIQFQNDANVPGHFYTVSQNIKGNVIFNTLGTGLGLAVLKDQKLGLGPMEAHIKMTSAPDAIYHDGFGMSGDLESYANAEFVVWRAKQLCAERGVRWIDGASPKTIAKWLDHPVVDAEKYLIAKDVFMEFGENLTVLYSEIARVQEENEWTVVCIGGIAQGKAIEAIIKGVNAAVKTKYPHLKLNIKTFPEAAYAGAIGALNLGIQAAAETAKTTVEAARNTGGDGQAYGDSNKSTVEVIRAAESKWGGELWKKEELKAFVDEKFDAVTALSAGPIFVPRSVVPNEARVGLTPIGIAFLRAIGVKNPIYVQVGCGVNRGTGEVYFSDDEYRRAGAEVLTWDAFVAKAQSVDRKTVVNTKDPQESEFPILKGATLFAYLHLAAHPELARRLCDVIETGIGYETIAFYDNGVLRTPVLRPASRPTGWLSALRYLETVRAKKEGLDLKSPAVQVQMGRWYNEDAGQYPMMPRHTTGALSGKTVVVLGGGEVGSSAAFAAADMGAAVYVTEINSNRITELEQMIAERRIRGAAGSVEVVARDQRTPIGQDGIGKHLWEADAIIGACYVEGSRPPVEIDYTLYRALVEHGNLEYMADPPIDQGGSIAIRPGPEASVEHTVEHTYEDGWIIEDGVSIFTVRNIPSLLSLQVSLGLERAKMPYLVASLMGLEKAIAAFPEFARGVNVYKGAVTQENVARDIGKEYLPLDTALSGAGLGARPTAEYVLPAGIKVNDVNGAINVKVFEREASFSVSDNAAVIEQKLRDILTPYNMRIGEGCLINTYLKRKVLLPKFVRSAEGLRAVIAELFGRISITLPGRKDRIEITNSASVVTAQLNISEAFRGSGIDAYAIGGDMVTLTRPGVSRINVPVPLEPAKLQEAFETLYGETPASDVPVAGTTLSLKDIVRHDVLNALLNMAINYSRGRNDNFIKHEYDGDAEIYWIKGGDFRGLLQYLLDCKREDLKMAKRSVENDTELFTLLMRNILSRSYISNEIRVMYDLSSFAEQVDSMFLLDYQLSGQFEHFGVGSGVSTGPIRIFMSSGMREHKDEIIAHVKAERALHWAVINKYFKGNLNNYREWRKSRISIKINVEIEAENYTEKKGAVTLLQIDSGSKQLTYNEFAEEAHKTADVIANVSRFKEIYKRQGGRNTSLLHGEVSVAGTASGQDGGKPDERKKDLAGMVRSLTKAGKSPEDAIIIIAMEGLRKFTIDKYKSVYELQRSRGVLKLDPLAGSDSTVRDNIYRGSNSLESRHLIAPIYGEVNVKGRSVRAWQLTRRGAEMAEAIRIIRITMQDIMTTSESMRGEIEDGEAKSVAKALESECRQVFDLKGPEFFAEMGSPINFANALYTAHLSRLITVLSGLSAREHSDYFGKLSNKLRGYRDALRTGADKFAASLKGEFSGGSRIDLPKAADAGAIGGASNMGVQAAVRAGTESASEPQPASDAPVAEDDKMSSISRLTKILDRAREEGIRNALFVFDIGGTLTGWNDVKVNEMGGYPEVNKSLESLLKNGYYSGVPDFAQVVSLLARYGHKVGFITTATLEETVGILHETMRVEDLNSVALIVAKKSNSQYIPSLAGRFGIPAGLATSGELINHLQTAYPGMVVELSALPKPEIVTSVPRVEDLLDKYPVIAIGDREEDCSWTQALSMAAGVRVPSIGKDAINNVAKTAAAGIELLLEKDQPAAPASSTGETAEVGGLGRFIDSSDLGEHYRAVMDENPGPTDRISIIVSGRISQLDGSSDPVSYNIIIGNGCIEIWERDAWDVRWYPVKAEMTGARQLTLRGSGKSEVVKLPARIFDLVAAINNVLGHRFVSVPSVKLSKIAEESEIEDHGSRPAPQNSSKAAALAKTCAEIKAMSEIAPQIGDIAELAGKQMDREKDGKYTLAVPPEMFKNKWEFNKRRREYGDRFNLVETSALTASAETFVNNLLNPKTIPEDQRSKTIALVPKSLSRDDLARLKDAKIRFIPVSDQLASVKSYPEDDRKIFQVNTFAAMHSLRHVNDSHDTASVVYRISAFYALRHITSKDGVKISIEDFIKAVVDGNVDILIDVCFEPVRPKDAEKEHDMVSKPLIFA